MKNEYDLVCRMNMAFGNARGAAYQYLPQLDAPPNEVHWDANAWGRLEKQCMNIMDEINELDVAMNRGVLDDIRDANCDIRVFVLGAAHFMGCCAFTSIPSSRYQGVGAVQALTDVYAHLMAALRRRDIEQVRVELREILHLSDAVGRYFGQDIAADMAIVVGAVMTRFVKSPNDLQATIDLHARKDVLLTYTEGDYPTMILKSSCDQPDAPKGKFLKSASCKKPVFPPLTVPLAPDLRSTLVDNGACLSCIDDKCVTGPKCVALSNPVATQGHP